MTPPSDSVATVDEQARRSFEAAWRDGHPQPIEHFLPEESHSQYQATLTELIHIELELAWKGWGKTTAQGGSGGGGPVLVEAYLKRFPCLNQPSIVLGLLEQEYRVRCLYGDLPSPREYRTRFPDLVLTGEEIKGTMPGQATAPEEVGQIPGYQVLGFLGRGGMGVVYKARHIRLHRIVALKMISAGVGASANELARLHTEAEAAARLQHPNIVQIYEVGETLHRPYLALEFVEGGNLAQRLAGAPQPARWAAQLVLTLARAMSAAHQRGIVHRDLKPANILLSAEGMPKITDFGLAKLLDSETGQTSTGATLGTPSYMAPEQALGKKSEIGPATDIYGLGAILYEALTGRPPFRGETPLSTLEQVRSQEPVPPSRLHPKTPRDLEIICLKCLHKQPRKRYGSAEELAGDLQRFQAGESIRARPTPAWERGIKWARRRPALAALLGVSSLAALTVLIVALWANGRLQQRFQEVQEQRRQALANFRKARDAVDRLTVLARERLPEVPQTETLRRDLLMDVVKFYEDFAQEKSNDPDVLCETGRAYRRLGEIYEAIGDLPKGEQSYQRAFEIQEQLVRRFPDLTAARQELAMNHLRLGVGYAAVGRHQNAEQRYRQALALQERLLAENPDDRDYRGELAVTHNWLGMTLGSMDRLPEAEKAFRSSLELMEQLAARFPADLRYPTHIGYARNNLGDLMDRTGQLAEAEKAFRQNLEMYEDLTVRYPTVADYRAKLGLALHNLAIIWAKTDRAQEAEQALRRTWDLRVQIAKDAPNMPGAQSRLADNLRPLAELVAKRGDRSEARRLFEMAVSHRKTAQKLAPQDPRYLQWLREDYDALAVFFLQIQDHAQAAKVAAEIAALVPKAPQDLVEAARLLARCLLLVENHAELAEDERRQLTATYTDQTLQWLREARRQGYKSHDLFTKDTSFESLRKRPEFQKVLSELAAGDKTQPQ